MWLSPDLAFAATVAGVLLIYVELCVPGRVVPGSLGAVCALGGAWCLGRLHPAAAGLILLALSIPALAAASVLRRFKLAAFTAAAFLSLGSALLLPAPVRIDWWLSVPLSLLLAAVSVALARLAWLGRTRKRACL